MSHAHFIQMEQSRLVCGTQKEHYTQVERSAEDALPAAQVLHMVLEDCVVLGLNVPAGQTVQVDDPDPLAYLPAGQAVHPATFDDPE